MHTGASICSHWSRICARRLVLNGTETILALFNLLPCVKSVGISRNVFSARPNYIGTYDRNLLAEVHNLLAEVHNLAEVRSLLAGSRSHLADVSSLFAGVRCLLADVRSFLAEVSSHFAGVRYLLAEMYNLLAEVRSFLAETRGPWPPCGCRWAIDQWACA